MELKTPGHTLWELEKMKAKAQAHANIALIKYWGKKDKDLALPMNSSLSLTLDAFYTQTEVEFSNAFNQDRFFLDGVEDKKALVRVSKFLDIFRGLKGTGKKALVRSKNFVPTAAGLASSASGFAALAGAANQALNLGLGKRELSRIARRGSGSATRSIYGGFVEWEKGYNDETSFARKIDNADWDIGMVAVIVNSKKKKISSREGMQRTVLTSPFYKEWVESSGKDLEEIKEAITNRGFKSIGRITESNALKMHATMFSASPAIIYFEPGTIKAMEIVKELREKEGISCYFTMDAGPNVKILCRLSDGEKIKKRLMEEFEKDSIVISGVGPSLSII